MLKFIRQNAKNTQSAGVDFYSPDYFAARERFIAVCERLGFARHALPIDATSPTDQPLTIDIGVAGNEHPSKALVVSSGVHGVEGFFGSAVQLAFLESLAANWQPADGIAVIFIHAVNPFGFAWQRRFNEDNVDLNRNFLRENEQYSGAPPLSGVFRRALMRHPSRPRLAPAASRMALLAMRHGVQSFWRNLPVGQYEYPDWLFFGGSARSQSARALDQILPAYLEHCEEAVHLDFHTGLGRWGVCKLLLNEQESVEHASWWKAQFPAASVSEVGRSIGHYQIRGGFGAWLQSRFPQCRYRFATAEFGTFSPMRVIGALADELHWHGKLGTQNPHHRARQRLTHTFVPRDRRWRSQTLETGVSLIQRASEALLQPIDAAEKITNHPSRQSDEAYPYPSARALC